MGSYFLLPAFIVAETTRALAVYALFSKGGVGQRVSPTLIAFLAEVGKLVFAIFFFWRKYYWRRRDGVSKPEFNGMSAMFYCFPAAFYLVNNLLYFTALQFSTPALMQCYMMSRLPFTAIGHHFIITRQRNVYAWTSLVALCAGLLVFNVKPTGADLKVSTLGLAAGPVIGLCIGIISAASGISTELLLKNSPDFWAGQIWLYFYGAVFSGGLAAMWDGNMTKTPPVVFGDVPSFIDSVTPLLLVVAITAAQGLIVANILRKKDNLVKLIGSSACVATVVIAQAIVYPSLRRETLTAYTILGAGSIMISSWTYSFYREQKGDDKISTKLPCFDDVDIETALLDAVDGGSPVLHQGYSKTAPVSPFWEPSGPKVGVACGTVILIALAFEQTLKMAS